MASANITFVSGVSQYFVKNVDDIINVDTSVYAVNVVFPSLTLTGLTKSYSLNDFTGNANTNNITISANGSTVNSGQLTSISTSFGSAAIITINQNEYLLPTFVGFTFIFTKISLFDLALIKTGLMLFILLINLLSIKISYS